MTQKEFNKLFIQRISENLDVYASNGHTDKPMICEAFNDTTDHLCKNGKITEHQYNNWCTPKGALNLSYLKGIRNKL
jgi:hypothetical protein